MPLELEEPALVADIRILDEAVDVMSEAVAGCIDAGGEASECQCAFPERLSAVKLAYDQTLALHPEWEGQSVLWWRDRNRSYSYNLEHGGS